MDKVTNLNDKYKRNTSLLFYCFSIFISVLMIWSFIFQVDIVSNASPRQGFSVDQLHYDDPDQDKNIDSGKYEPTYIIFSEKKRIDKRHGSCQRTSMTFLSLRMNHTLEL